MSNFYVKSNLKANIAGHLNWLIKFKWPMLAINI